MRVDHLLLARYAVLLLAPPLFGACQGEPRAGAAGWTPTYVTDHHVHILSPELVRDWKSLGVPFSRPDSAYTSVSAVFSDEAGLKLHLPASEISLTRRDHLQLLSVVAARAARERRSVLIHLAPVEGELHEEEVRAFIDHVVDPHPDLELYLAHLGGNGGFRASARRSIRAFTTYLHANEANARREIYFELSGALLSRSMDGVPASRRSDARELITGLQGLGLERVLFGSDYPVFDAMDFANLLYERLPLSHAELGRLMQQQAPAFEPQAASVTR